VKHHGVFQGYYFSHHSGSTGMRASVRGHPAVRRVRGVLPRYDQKQLPTGYEKLPLGTSSRSCARCFAAPRQSIYVNRRTVEGASRRDRVPGGLPARSSVRFWPFSICLTCRNYCENSPKVKGVDRRALPAPVPVRKGAAGSVRGATGQERRFWRRTIRSSNGARSREALSMRR